MRVALVCGDYRPERDGVAHYVQRLAAELTRRGVHVDVPDAPAEWDLAGVGRAARALRRLRPDVVHVQFAPSAFGWHGEVGLLPALLGRRARLVVTVHEYDWWGWGPPVLARTGRWDRETGLLVPRARAVVATNPSHARAVRARFPRQRVLEVPIGANLRAVPVDRARARAELGLPADAPLLAFFGFVHAVKGIRHLVEAVTLLREARPDLRLALVGGFESLALRGREAADYRAEVEAMVGGLGDAVTLTGWQPEDVVGRWLSAADVAVLPFTAGTTTKSGSLLACAQYGLPLVATAADPPDPALIDGDTALLVGVRDGPAIAKAVERVLADTDLAAFLGDRARRLAARHSWAAIAAAHVDLYRDVAGRGRRASAAGGRGI